MKKETSSDVWLRDKKRLVELLAQVEEATKKEALSRSVVHSETVGTADFYKFLTARQKEVLAGVEKDWQNKEIANALNISVRTVKFHVSALLVIAGVSSRRELVALRRK